MQAPRLSILLPVWNGARDLARLLPALEAQHAWGECELVAIDSSSRDASVELLRAAGASVEVIPKEAFGHGRTRNALAARARGRHLVFLSQDALPAGPEFLDELVRPLEEEGVAGAYARLLPHEDDDPLTARTVLSAPEARSEAPELPELAPDELWRAGGAARLERLRFSNVASAVRAEVLREHPFPEVPFGEDFAWAARVAEAGWRVRFAPRAVALHAHRYSPAQAFERYRLDAAFHRAVHGHRLRPSLASVLRGVAWELREDLRFLARSRGASWAHALRAPGLRTAQVLGQYWGSRGWGGDFWAEGGQ